MSKEIFKPLPDDHYIDWTWLTGAVHLNQRGLEQMTIMKRKRLLMLLAKAQKGS